MATKKNVNKIITAPKRFNVEKTSKGTFLDGIANAFVVDRGKDIVETDAWKRDGFDGLSNYLKNPIILFNHDGDVPIGKADAIQQTPDGLKIKAQISRSKDPYISRIRDLVDEKILRAFSIGFNSHDEQKDADGINRIKSAELYEVSVVSVPMNPDSVFEISEKRIKESIDNRETIDELEQQICQANRMPLSASFHQNMAKLCQGKKNYANERIRVMKQIAELSGLSEDDVLLSLRTMHAKIPSSIKAAMSKVFAIDPAELDYLAKEQEGSDTEEEKALVKGQTSEDSGHRHMATWSQESGAGQTVETLGKFEDHVHQIVDGKIVANEGHSHSLNLNSDEAKGNEEEDKDKKKPKDEEEKTTEATESKQSDEEPSSDKMEDEDDQEQKQADQEGVSDVTVAIDGDPSEEVGAGQPALELAKQTNVLLGQLVREIQMLTAQVRELSPGQQDAENEEQSVDSIMSDAVQQEDDQSKSIRKLDLLTKYIENLDMKLKSLNI